IVVSAMHAGANLYGPLRVLDFGCGAARQILHLTRLYPQLQISACDVDFDVIRFVQQAYPQVDAYASSFDPPLRYPDGTFDLIYSVSIFSHLSFDDRKLWLAELSRVLKPGGLAILTFNGLYSLRVAHRRGLRKQFTEQQLEQQGFVFDAAQPTAKEVSRRVEDPRFGELGIGISRIYGEMYYDPARVGDYFALNGL